MPRYFRLVCAHDHEKLVEDLLQTQGYVFAQEPFSPLAYKLLEEPKALGGSVAAAFGLIYIQDRSSMLAPLFLRPPHGAMVLDMCASPGSKSGFLAQLVGQNGLVLANEPNERRLSTLRRNMAAMNLPQAVTCRHPGQSLPLAEASLPCIQLDPPCSGWGTVERNPRIREIWPEHKLKPLIGLQRALLRHAAKLLAPGGRLLYSTCTTNPAENQDQVLWSIDTLGLNATDLPALPGVSAATPTTGIHPWLQVQPDSDAGQGFFFAALTKSKLEGQGQVLENAASTGEKSRLPGQVVDVRNLPGHEFVAWGKLPPGEVFNFNGRVFFLHQKTAVFPGTLRWQGFELGRMHGKSFHLNTSLRKLLPEYRPGNGISTTDIRDLEALLQGRSLPLPAGLVDGARSGLVGLYWRELPLGWLKVKAGRCLWSPR